MQYLNFWICSLLSLLSSMSVGFGRLQKIHSCGEVYKVSTFHLHNRGIFFLRLFHHFLVLIHNVNCLFFAFPTSPKSLSLGKWEWPFMGKQWMMILMSNCDEMQSQKQVIMKFLFCPLNESLCSESLLALLFLHLEIYTDNL